MMDELKAQEEFLRAKLQPSARVIRGVQGAMPMTSSTESEERQTSLSLVVGDVKEHTFHGSTFTFELKSNRSVSFPKAVHRDIKQQQQQKQAIVQVSQPDLSADCSTCSMNSNDTGAPVKEDLESVKREVARENDGILSNMSQADILAERDKLLKTLDPNLLRFIQSRQQSLGKSVLGSLEQQTAGTADEPVTSGSVAPQSVEGSQIDAVQSESEKMAWMDPLSTEDNNQRDHRSARFDFEGNLLPPIANISFREGLHHHGDEPDKPGYTVEELFTLCRSALPSQRVLALSTLAKIIIQAKRGSLDSVLDAPLMQKALEAGLCTLIRHTFDEVDVTILQAVASVLAALLHNPIDEACLDQTFLWWRGCMQPILQPPSLEFEHDAEDAEPSTDEAVCLNDTIKGLVQMQLLERLRYLLEVLRPQSASFLIDTISSLMRIARHSTWAASKICDCPGLLDVLTEQFLCLTWTSADHKSMMYPVYGCPYWGVIKLFRLIAATGRDLAQLLFERTKGFPFLVRYLISQPIDLALPLPDACLLIAESYRLWITLLEYGIAVEWFSDLYPELLAHLHEAVRVDRTSLVKRPFAWDRTLLCCGALEKLIVWCFCSDKDSSSSDPVKSLTIGLLKAAASVLAQLSHNYDEFGYMGDDSVKNAFWSLISGLAGCLATSTTFGALKQEFTAPVIQISQRLQEALLRNRKGLDSCSLLLASASEFTCSNRDPEALPSIQSTSKDCKALCPVVSENSLIPVLVCWCRFLHGLKSIGLASNLVENFLSSPSISSFVSRIALVDAHTVVDTLESKHWFLRFEVDLLYWLCLLDNKSTLGILTTSLLRIGDEAMAYDLWNHIMVADFFSSLGDQEAVIASKPIIDDALSSLPAILQCFHATGNSIEHRVRESVHHTILAGYRASQFCTLEAPQSCTLDGRPDLLCGPAWMFQPLHAVCAELQIAHEQGHAVRSLSRQQFDAVLSSLKLVQLLLARCPETLIRVTGIETLYCRYSEVFLLGNSVYLDTKVQPLLAHALQWLSSRISEINFSKSVFGLKSFLGLYTNFCMYCMLLFEADSFGDPLFAQFLLLPLCSALDTRLQMAFWSEDHTVATMCNLKRNEFILPTSMLMCCGSDVGVLSCYARVLASESVTPARNPMLFEIATEELKRACENPDPPRAIHRFVEQLVQNETIRKALCI